MRLGQALERVPIACPGSIQKRQHVRRLGDDGYAHGEGSFLVQRFYVYRPWRWPKLIGPRENAPTSPEARRDVMRVVVCGGGVIGASTAYFLSRRGADVIVVERTGVAYAASGKAGAFLALDWYRGSPLDALARRSFTLHAQLAEEIDGDWGYHRVTTYGGVRCSRRRGTAGGAESGLWTGSRTVWRERARSARRRRRRWSTRACSPRR